MSIFSDHESGYMDDFEYQQECRRMNRAEREYDEFDDDELDEEEENGE